MKWSNGAQDEDLKRLPKVKNLRLPIFLRAVSAGVAVVSLERVVESMNGALPGGEPQMGGSTVDPMEV